MVQTQRSRPAVAELREMIDAALEECLRLGVGCPPALQEAIRYSVLGSGKRLRPRLVLMAAQACGGDVVSALPVACAVELVHAYSLVHDDLPAMDDDDLRRGRPTCHKAFGEATAILVGDALLTQAFGILAERVQPPEVAALCCGELARAAGACGMVGGQAADLESESGGGDVELLESIHRRKTGAMLRVSLRLGGIVAGADAERIDALDRYGTKLGLAFQITDDLLDAAGNQDAAGKRVGKDHRRGKLTYPGLLGVEESRRRATALVDAAIDSLAPFGNRAMELSALARYILERDR